MARQIQGGDLPPIGQSRLREHPGVEIGAEAGQQENRDTVAVAERKSGSQRTHRWREMDSNFRFRASGNTPH
jgi:hypothetical protein